MKQRGWTLKWCFTTIKKKWWLAMLIAIVFIAICGIIGYYSEIKIGPEYETSVTFLIKEPEVYTNDQVELSYSDYQAINKSIMNHFSSLLKMESVIDEVIDNLQLDIDYKEFITKMDVEIIDYSTMLRLKITDNAPELAEKIIDELITMSTEKANEMFKIENIEIIDDIQTSVVPKKSSIKQNMIISGVLGFLVSFLVIFLLEYSDKTIKSLGDIKYALGLSVIGVIGNLYKRDKLVMCEAPDSFIADTYRNAIINISSMQKEKGIKTIVFTSPIQKVHKSYITANIAIALSRTGKSVLLIDGDLRKSSLSNIFGMEAEMGLSDIIEGKVLSNQIIVESQIEKNLDILPSGKTSSNSADLLASEDMKVLLEKLEEQYDLILIDCPSLEIVADTVIISTVTDGTILVCGQRETEIEDTRVGKRKLEMVDSNVLGILLEMKNSKDSENTKIC